MYYIEKDGFYFIFIGEVFIINIFWDEILLEDDFLVKLIGYIFCFWCEVGFYGVYVWGLNWVYQFDKVEIVCYEYFDCFYEVLEEMFVYVGGLFDKFGLFYCILCFCGGDLGFIVVFIFDFEVYFVVQ